MRFDFRRFAVVRTWTLLALLGLVLAGACKSDDCSDTSSPDCESPE